MIDTKTPFKLIANCLPVKGASRSAICDLHRQQIKLVPNDLYDILNNHKGKNIEDIKRFYKNKYDDIIDEYFEFLVEHDFIFFTNSGELFPDMSLEWDEPNIITNSIIDIDNSSKYKIEKTLIELSKLNCKYLEIRFLIPTGFDDLKELVNILNIIESSIISIDITLPYRETFKENDVFNFLDKFSRVSSFRIYSSHESRFISHPNQKKKYIIYSDNTIINEKCCGLIDYSFFSSNIKTFTEALAHNSCLNRKISIDVNGNIKNCPSMAQSFGNIKDTRLNEAIAHKDFKKYWNITKDQIDVCKDCEFRYVCTDCRAYKENPENDYSKPLKCGYDPYTNEWKEWSVNPLKQKAIEYYGMQELIKKDD